MKNGNCVRYDARENTAKEGSQSGFMDEKEESAAGSEKVCLNVNVLETSNKHIRLTGYEVASIEALRDIGSPEIALEALQLFAMIGNRFLLEKAVLYLKKMLEEERLKH